MVFVGKIIGAGTADPCPVASGAPSLLPQALSSANLSPGWGPGGRRGRGRLAGMDHSWLQMVHAACSCWKKNVPIADPHKEESPPPLPGKKPPSPWADGHTQLGPKFPNPTQSYKHFSKRSLCQSHAWSLHAFPKGRSLSGGGFPSWIPDPPASVPGAHTIRPCRCHGSAPSPADGACRGRSGSLLGVGRALVRCDLPEPSFSIDRTPFPPAASWAAELAGENVKYEFLGHILRSLVAFFVIILNEAKNKF